jgi:hypothetical protein
VAASHKALPVNSANQLLRGSREPTASWRLAFCAAFGVSII